jgi:TPR repeat protein
VNQRIRTFVAGGLLALVLFGAAQAGPLEDAKALLQRRDYAAAAEILRPLADRGNAEAQYNLSLMYLEKEQDYAQARVWARKAAGQGYAPAQAQLGGYYQTGIVVPQ